MAGVLSCASSEAAADSARLDGPRLFRAVPVPAVRQARTFDTWPRSAQPRGRLEPVRPWTALALPAARVRAGPAAV